MQKDLSTPLVMEQLDNANGAMVPFYDDDTNMVYLCGRVSKIIK